MHKPVLCYNSLLHKTVLCDYSSLHKTCFVQLSNKPASRGGLIAQNPLPENINRWRKWMLEMQLILD